MSPRASGDRASARRLRPLSSGARLGFFAVVAALLALGVAALYAASVWPSGGAEVPVASLRPADSGERPAGSLQPSSPAQAQAEVLFSLPLGAAGVGVAMGGQDQPPSGPSTIVVDEDGVVWIADSVLGRLLPYSAAGRRVKVIDLSQQEVGVSDLAVRGDQLAVLDISRSVVLLLDPESGSVRQMVRLPQALGLAAGLSGIDFGPDGDLLLEFEGGSRTARLADVALGSAAIQAGRPLADGWLTIGYDRPPGALGHRAEVHYRAATVEIVTEDFLGGVILVGEWQGGIDLLVDEMSQGADGRMIVVQTVRRFDSDGRLTAIWTAPIDEAFTHVAHAFATGPDGSVLMLLPRADRVDVLRAPLAGT